MTPKSDWVWMPHPAHFICARDCKFFLATYVGGFIVSTVGEYVPGYESTRNILAESRGFTLEGRGDTRLADYMKKVGFEEIGHGRKYETFVFPAGPVKSDCGCNFKPTSWSEIDSKGSNDPQEAVAGHMELCEKYAAMPVYVEGQ